jgi:hypothetical protein
VFTCTFEMVSTMHSHKACNCYFALTVHLTDNTPWFHTHGKFWWEGVSCFLPLWIVCCFCRIFVGVNIRLPFFAVKLWGIAQALVTLPSGSPVIMILAISKPYGRTGRWQSFDIYFSMFSILKMSYWQNDGRENNTTFSIRSSHNNKGTNFKC